ncbi:MAG: hypothetical protein Q8761_02705 [Sweet potato little leaf phytoplasma]|nr:hypothetical protein [Sweet potato little leaf phytoplasma]
MDNVSHLPEVPEDIVNLQQNRVLQQNPPLEQKGQQNNQAENPILVVNDRARAIQAYAFSKFEELNP